MDYWLTTHYPHPVPDTVPWHIFFREKPVMCPAVGDRVLFYESLKPLPERAIPGRKSIVCAAVISGDLMPMSGIDPWVYQVSCDRHCFGTPVPLSVVRVVVPGPFYRRTLRRLNRDQYTAIAIKMGVQS